MKQIALLLFGICLGINVKAQNIDDVWDAYDKRDYKMVIKLAKSLAENGNIEACALLGDAYEHMGKIEEGIPYVEKAAKAKYGFSCYKMGYLYANGIYFEQNLDKAEYWFKTCIDVNEGKAKGALVLLSMIYLDTQRKSEAKELLEKAMLKGDKYSSPVLLAKNFCSKEPERALGYYRIAAEAGNEEAMRMMGEYFEEGKYVDKDFLEAAKWYERAYYNSNNWDDNQTAMYRLGHIYEKLYRKSLDERYLRQSLKWFYKSVEHNPIGAQVFIIPDDDEDDKEYAEAINPMNRFYSEGVLDAHKYTSYQDWLDKVVSVIAQDSDVDIDIPQNKQKANETYALIISNENYAYEQYIPYAESDGEIFGKYCEITLGIPTKNIHVVTDAGLNKMKREMDWLTETVTTQNAKKIIFYYSGHGMPADDLHTSYLLPIDGYAKNPSTGYNLAEIYKALGSLNVETIVILDACFSGTNRNGESLIQSKGVAIKAKDVMPQGKIVVLSACQGTESAQTYTDQKHSLFTYYLLKVLQTQGEDISLGSLFDKVKADVSKHAMPLCGKNQTPNVGISPAMANNWRQLKLK